MTCYTLLGVLNPKSRWVHSPLTRSQSKTCAHSVFALQLKFAPPACIQGETGGGSSLGDIIHKEPAGIIPGRVTEHLRRSEKRARAHYFASTAIVPQQSRLKANEIGRGGDSEKPTPRCKLPSKARRQGFNVTREKFGCKVRFFGGGSVSEELPLLQDWRVWRDRRWSYLIQKN